MKTLALIICLTIAALAQQQPRDVQGWRQAKWRMTEAQVLDAFKDEAIALDKDRQTSGKEHHATIAIPKMGVEGITLTARFQFDNVTNLLDEVALEPIDAKPYPARSYFERLEPLLIAKYGTPSHRTSPDEVHESWGAKSVHVTWNFPTTTIKLSYLENDDVLLRKYDYCYITYAAHRDNKL
jgi:hypothetical protein